MKINFGSHVADLKGVALKDEKGEDVKLHVPCVNALTANYQKENDIGGDEKYRRYKLAVKIDKPEEIEVTSEEITLIKKLVGFAFTPILVGGIFDKLEGSGPDA